MVLLAAVMTARIALVTVTKGYRHTSIPTAEAVIGGIADRTNWFTIDYLRTDAETRRMHSQPQEVQRLSWKGERGNGAA